jgi:hypothetical protein
MVNHTAFSELMGEAASTTAASRATMPDTPALDNSRRNRKQTTVISNIDTT